MVVGLRRGYNLNELVLVFILIFILEREIFDSLDNFSKSRPGVWIHIPTFYRIGKQMMENIRRDMDSRMDR